MSNIGTDHELPPEEGSTAATAASGDDTAAGVSDSDEERAQEVAAQAEPTHQAQGIGVIDDGTDHYGQDGGRDTLTVSETQRAMSDEQEQRLPAMSQNNASQVEKIAGIVAQTRQDASNLERHEVVHILAQRLEQSGLDVPDAEVEELADQVLVGDDSGTDN